MPLHPLALRTKLPIRFSSTASEIKSDGSSPPTPSSTPSPSPSSDSTERYILFIFRVLVLLGVLSGFKQNTKLFQQCSEDGEEIRLYERAMDQITTELCQETFLAKIWTEEEREKGKKGQGEKGPGEEKVKVAVRELIERYERDLQAKLLQVQVPAAQGEGEKETGGGADRDKGRGE
jgi:hypothetical protein